jgi:hypothetical protein
VTTHKTQLVAPAPSEVSLSLEGGGPADVHPSLPPAPTQSRGRGVLAAAPRVVPPAPIDVEESGRYSFCMTDAGGSVRVRAGPNATAQLWGPVGGNEVSPLDWSFKFKFNRLHTNLIV